MALPGHCEQRRLTVGLSAEADQVQATTHRASFHSTHLQGRRGRESGVVTPTLTRKIRPPPRPRATLFSGQEPHRAIHWSPTQRPTHTFLCLLRQARVRATQVGRRPSNRSKKFETTLVWSRGNLSFCPGSVCFLFCSVRLVFCVAVPSFCALGCSVVLSPGLWRPPARVCSFLAFWVFLFLSGRQPENWPFNMFHGHRPQERQGADPRTGHFEGTFLRRGTFQTSPSTITCWSGYAATCGRTSASTMRSYALSGGHDHFPRYR